jgi:bacterioferritin-associated ferredoxin
MNSKNSKNSKVTSDQSPSPHAFLQNTPIVGAHINFKCINSFQVEWNFAILLNDYDQVIRMSCWTDHTDWQKSSDDFEITLAKALLANSFRQDLNQILLEIVSLELKAKKENQYFFTQLGMMLKDSYDDYRGATTSFNLAQEDSFLICRCYGISKNRIMQEFENGKTKTLAEIKRATMASTGCGTCLCDLAYIVELINEENQSADQRFLQNKQKLTQEIEILNKDLFYLDGKSYFEWISLAESMLEKSGLQESRILGILNSELGLIGKDQALIKTLLAQVLPTSIKLRFF